MKLHLTLLTMGVSVCALAHPSARLHEQDIFRAFAGYDNPAFPQIVRMVSSGMDNELPRRFRKKIGSVPCNHRLLGHGWTFGDAIPRRVFEAIERKHPGASAIFVELWLEFSGQIVSETARLTGLERRQAQALDALIHDVHLLGDRTPDNKLVEYVLTTKEICRNLIKEMRILWPSDTEYVETAQTVLRNAYAQSAEEPERAIALLAAIQRLGWGVRLKRKYDIISTNGRHTDNINHLAQGYRGRFTARPMGRVCRSVSPDDGGVFARAVPLP